MNKIVNYIKNGKGYGLLFLLAASAVMTLILMFPIKNIYFDLRPQVMLTAKDMLPLTIKNHKIVSPENTYKKLIFTFGNDEFPVILDTRAETSEMPKGEGLFILNDAVYLATPSQIRKIQFQNDGVIDIEKFEKMIDDIVERFFIIVPILILAAYFLMALFKAGLAVLIGFFGQKFVSDTAPYDKGILMRLCAIITAVVETICFFSSLTLKISLNQLQMLLVIIIAEFIFLYREKTNKD